jgi:predicted dehydrogenase
MTTRRFNIAVVGLGFGAEFIPIWQRYPLRNCYAVCQRNPEKLKEVAGYWDVDRRYTDFDALLMDPNVDAVHIARVSMSMARRNRSSGLFSFTFGD